jgi:hypothetical protein
MAHRPGGIYRAPRIAAVGPAHAVDAGSGGVACGIPARQLEVLDQDWERPALSRSAPAASPQSSLAVAARLNHTYGVRWHPAQWPDLQDAKMQSALIHEAAETHHQVFRITDGADQDWASWYAQWLVTLSELPEVLGGTVVRSELTYLLVRLDKEYTEGRADEPWEDYYARELVRHFSPD